MTLAKYPASGSGSGDVSGPGIAVTDNGIVLWDGTGGTDIKDGGVGSANQILRTDGTTPSFGLLTNANVDASAAIAYSKLNLSGSIVNADVNASAAIAYSKLALSDSIVNADINSAAAIAYSKLALTGSIVNADVNASAAIAYSKLAALTASRVLESDGSGFVSASSVTSTELGYLSGVTSGLQTQLDGKVSDTGDTMTGDLIIDSGAGAGEYLQMTGSAAAPTLYLSMAKTGGSAQTWLAGMNAGNTNNYYGIRDDTNGRNILQARPSGFVQLFGDWNFDSAINLNASSNQIVMRTGSNELTINSGSSAAARTYTVPDVGTTGTFALLEGAQTFTGAKTFDTNDVTLDGGRLIVKENDQTDDAVIITRDADEGYVNIYSAGSLVTSLRGNGDNYIGGGNVGIGTASPSALLDLEAATDVDIDINSSTSNRAGIQFQHAGTTSFSIGCFTSGWNLYLGDLATNVFNVSSTGAVTLGPSVSAGVDGVAHVINTGDQAGTYTYSTARAGTIQFANWFATTAAPTILGISNDSTSGFGSGLVLAAGTNNGNGTGVYGDMIFDVRENDDSTFATTSNKAFTFNVRNVNIGVATRAGAWSNISGGSWGTISDARLKKNIQSLESGLDKILSLRPVTYEWRDEAVSPLRPTTNFIAQEVELIDPSWVVETGQETITEGGEQVTFDNVKQVQLGSSFTATLVKAIQELAAKVEALEAAS